MKRCADCPADISLTCWRTRYCPDCLTRRRRDLHTRRQAKRRAEAAHEAWRAMQRATRTGQHDEATCPDCHTSLWGAPVRCAIGQRLHDERLRAEQARARKPVVMSQREQEDAARIERTLAALAARRRRQRMSLTVEDCWRGAGSMAGAWEGAEA